MRAQIRLLCLLFATCTLSVIPSITSISAPAIAQTVSSQKEEAERLKKQGDDQINQNQAQEALKSLRRALDIYQAIKERSGEGQTLKSIGNAYDSLKEHRKALEYQQKALAIAREINDRDLEARALNNIGIAYKDLKQIDQAIAFFKQSFRIAQNTRNEKMILTSTLNLVEAYLVLKKHSEAVNYYQVGLKALQEIGNKHSVTELTMLVGHIYDLQSQYAFAIENYKQALQLSEQHDNKFRAKLFHSIGVTYSKQGQYDQAIEYLKKSLEIQEKSQNLEMKRQTLHLLGLCYGFKQNEKQAIFYHEQALAIARTLQRKDFEVETLNLLGSSHAALSEYQKAKDLFEESLAIYRESKNKPKQLEQLVSLISIQYFIASASLKDQEDYQQPISQANLILQLVPEALSLSKELADPRAEKEIRNNESSAYSIIGNAYEGLADLSKAEEFFQKAIITAQNSENFQTEREALSHLQGLYSSKGEHYRRIPLIQRSIQLSKKLNNPINEIYDLLGLANIYRTDGEIQKALSIYKQALKKIESTSPASVSKKLQPSLQKAQFIAQSSLMRIYLDTIQYDQALKIAQQNLQFSESMSDPEIRVGALIKIAEVYIKRGNLSIALERLQEALEVARSSNRLDLEIETLIELSSAWIARGDSGKAISFAQQAMATAGKVKPNKLYRLQQRLNLQRDARSALTNAYIDQGDYDKALETLQQGIEQEKQLKSLLDQAIGSQYKLGVFYASLGNYPKAAEQFEQMLTKAQSIKYSLLESIAWNLLSQSAFLQQQPQKALEFAQRGVAVAQQNQLLSYEFANQESLSRAYGELGEEQKSMASAQKALSIAHKLRSREKEKRALALLASLNYRFNHLDDALLNYQSALTIRSNSQPGDLLVQSDDSTIYAGLARVYADRKQPAAAITFYKKAVNGIQGKRQQLKSLPVDLQKSFLEATIDFKGIKASDIYRQLADQLLSQGQILEAQQVLELLKIQEIQEFDRTTRAKISETGKLLELSPSERKIIEGEKYNSYISFIQKTRECQASNCPELSKLTALREQARHEYSTTIKALDDELEKRKKDDEKNFLDPRNALSSKAITLIDNRSDRAVVYSLVADNRIWLIVATKDAPLRTIEVSVNRADLSKAVDEFRTAMEKCQQPGSVCTHADTKFIQQISQKIYGWLFPAELQKELPPDRIKHLMFSLDRNIRYIPMSALFDGKNYLVEKYAISTITTADRPENQPFSLTVQNTSVLAMGASEFPDGLSPLPNVETELNAIVKSKPQDRVGIYPGAKYINKDFSRSNLQNSLLDRNILHLASHGIFNLNTPYESYIALGNNDKLKLPEIKDLLLSGIDLVVLSACQTALGGRENQEGVEIASLASAFLEQNRAKSVIASLWNVDDISTSLLMQEFYQTLAKNTLQTPITRAEALRQTQQQFLTGKITINDAKQLPNRTIVVQSVQLERDPNQTPDYRHPYYWSPFVLMGSGF